MNKAYKYGMNIELDPGIDVDRLTPTSGTLEISDESVMEGEKSIKIEGKKDITIKHSAQGTESADLIITLEPGSESTIILEKEGEGAFISENTRIIAKKNSKLTFIGFQSLSEDTVVFQSRDIDIHKDARVEMIDVSLGGKYSKLDVKSKLLEEGAEAANSILFMTKGKKVYNGNAESHHLAPNTMSELQTKGVLKDHSRALSRGLVKMGNDSRGSSGHQRQDSLLLSGQAEADAIPKLEIENHDVKCSHGTTIGEPDKEKLFYMMSRGLSEEEAKMKIIEGYFSPVIERVVDESLKKRILEAIR